MSKVEELIKEIDKTPADVRMGILVKDFFEDKLDEIQAEQEELQKKADAYDELSKPVEVPQFVAEYLEIRKEKYPVGGLGSAINRPLNGFEGYALEKWMNNNVETFARAWINRYTVKHDTNYQILKLHVDYFDDVADGVKTFEIRKNDRDYQVGNILVLREYDPIDSYTGAFTGRECRARITYITDYAQKDNYVVLGIVLVEEVAE